MAATLFNRASWEGSNLARTFIRKASSLPFVIKPSKDEISRSTLNARNVEAAVRHLHQDGLVVINDVVPHEQIDYLNTKMVEDARTLQARGKDGPFNYNQGNLQQDAPPVKDYFFPSIFMSKNILPFASFSEPFPSPGFPSTRVL